VLHDDLLDRAKDMKTVKTEIIQFGTIQMDREEIIKEPDLQQIDLMAKNEIQLVYEGRLYLFTNNGELRIGYYHTDFFFVDFIMSKDTKIIKIERTGIPNIIESGRYPYTKRVHVLIQPKEALEKVIQNSKESITNRLHIDFRKHETSYILKNSGKVSMPSENMRLQFGVHEGNLVFIEFEVEDTNQHRFKVMEVPNKEISFNVMQPDQWT
jgi:hypothetical protein